MKSKLNSIENNSSETKHNWFAYLLYIPILLFGLFVVLFMSLAAYFQNKGFRKTTTSTTPKPSAKKSTIKKKISSPKPILVENDKLKLHHYFAGAIRFGPEYYSIKSTPQVETLENTIYGDWFYKIETGFFLQKWNSIQEANADLIFINSEELQVTTLYVNIPSVFWDMNKLSEKEFTLTCYSGSEKLVYKVDL